MRWLLLVSLAVGPAWAQPYPPAANPAKVGSYPALTKSGGGLVYDEVLEYRVWFQKENGHSAYHAFATFEQAEAFGRKTPRAETPLVLVRQSEWINEPDPQHRVLKKGTRLTEWRPEWLKGNKRSQELLKKLLAAKAHR
jgi:hypothetical protein